MRPCCFRQQLSLKTHTIRNSVKMRERAARIATKRVLRGSHFLDWIASSLLASVRADGGNVLGEPI